MQEPGWTKLCLLLDYDGWVSVVMYLNKMIKSINHHNIPMSRTLAPHGSHPDLTVLPQQTRAVLQRLADMRRALLSVTARAK